MSDLNKKYDEILLDLKENIKNQNDYEFVKNKISELTMVYMDSLDKLLNFNDKQLKIERQLKRMETRLENIEDDIYITESNSTDNMHDNDYGFEIVCPYCDYEFVADSSSEEENEIECPKCHNIIELDWNEDWKEDCSSCNLNCPSKNNANIKNSDENVKVAEDDENYDTESKKTENDRKQESNTNQGGSKNQKENKNNTDDNKKNEDDM